MHIDQSIKVSSWGNELHPLRSETHQIFQKYAQSQKNTFNGYEQEQEFKNHASEEFQASNIESGFRKLKNEQIQKLKDLKNEYQEIRKITTDYAQPKGSRTPSMHSSSQSQSQAMISPKAGKVKTTSNREVQILELQKKQLQIMIENSMKKIEELLHNEMQYKKTIHQLRLQRENKNGNEGDNEAMGKLLKRKEKDFNERVKVLELERETFFSTITTYKDRIKYLESSLSTSQQELRKILDEKRNFQELIRMEKDRYMNLQIQFRREKREHEIIEKDRNSEINRLLKLKDVKDTSLQRQLKNKLADLQEDIKIKDERYSILIQKFQSYQKEEKERLREEKESQLRAVNEILTKSASGEPQNKLLQDTISGILNRLSDLQKKPIIEIDHIVNHEKQEHYETISQYQTRVSQLLKIHNEKQHEILAMKSENERITLSHERLEREIQMKAEHEANLIEEIERLKKFQKTFRKDKSVERFNEFKIRAEPAYTVPNVSTDQVRILETRITNISRDYETISSEKAFLQEENRQLRLTISKLEFQVEKREKEKDFSLGLQEKSFKSSIEESKNLNQQLTREVAQLKNEIITLRQVNERNFQLKTVEIQQLSQTIDALRRQKANVDNLIKENAFMSVNKVRTDHSLQLNELTSTIQSLTTENQRMRQQRQQYLAVLQENQRLVEYLKRTRLINSETDRLWNAKEAQYERIDGVLHAILR